MVEGSEQTFVEEIVKEEGLQLGVLLVCRCDVTKEDALIWKFMSGTVAMTMAEFGP